MHSTRRRLAVIILLGVHAMGVSWSRSMRAHAADDESLKNEPAQNDLAAELIGTWKLEKASTPGSPSGVGSRLKFFTGTHWCIIQPDPKTGVVVFQHGGRYELKGTTLTTQHDFAGASTKSMIGRPTTLDIQIDGDTMEQTDADAVFNETWKRAK